MDLPGSDLCTHRFKKRAVPGSGLSGVCRIYPIRNYLCTNRMGVVGGIAAHPENSKTVEKKYKEKNKSKWRSFQKWQASFLCRKILVANTLFIFCRGKRTLEAMTVCRVIRFHFAPSVSAVAQHRCIQTADCANISLPIILLKHKKGIESAKEKEKRMENIVKDLLEKLSFYYNDKANAGEYLTQHLDEVKDTDTLEDILLTILMYCRKWSDNGSNFNQDYRQRLIQWFTRKEYLSPVLQAGVTKLMEYDSKLPIPVIDLERLESRQKKQKQDPLPACTEKQELKLWLVEPEMVRGRGTALASVTEQKEKLYQYLEYLHFFRDRITDITAQSGRKCTLPEKTLSDLIQKNIFASAKSTQYQFLQAHYTEMEIAAFNLYFYEYAEDIKRDNIKVRFLRCLSEITEAEELDAFKLSMIKTILSSSFSRNVANYKKCEAYFRSELPVEPSMKEEFHTIFQSDEAYRDFYESVKTVVNFEYRGYLRFDPLLPGNRGKWEMIQNKDKIDLLEYRAKTFLLHDPHARYSEEQQKQIEILHELAKDLFEELKSPNSDATLPEFLICNQADSALTVFLQAELETMLTSIKDVRIWYDELEPPYQYLYQLKLWQGIGEINTALLLGWNARETSGKSCSLLNTVGANPYLSDDEKQQYFYMVQEAVWKDRRDYYPDFLYHLLAVHEELAMRFLNKETLTEIAKELCHEHPTLIKKLANYLMSQDERDIYLKEELKRQEEKKEKEELFKFQRDVKIAMKELIFNGNYWKIGYLSDNCLNEMLTKIAIRNEVEQWDGTNISSLIYKLAYITSETKCHSVLLQTIQNFCNRQEDMA